jgi:hypothetical protein
MSAYTRLLPVCSPDALRRGPQPVADTLGHRTLVCACLRRCRSACNFLPYWLLTGCVCLHVFVLDWFCASAMSSLPAIFRCQGRRLCYCKAFTLVYRCSILFADIGVELRLSE